jgi:hypothetical protein
MRDHDAFLQLLARLHSVAAGHGDTQFADAVGKCIVDASGGSPAGRHGATRRGRRPAVIR